MMKWSGSDWRPSRPLPKVDEGKVSKALAKKLKERKEKVDGRRAEGS